MRIPRFLAHLAHPVIRDERELSSYIVRVCAVCATAALAVDVANQLVFSVSWAEALRSWSITVVLASAIAFPVSRSIGKAHLALFRSKQEFERRSRTDELTGLLNRRAMMEIAASGRPETMVLVIADIDRFKTVNDLHGHMTGDAVIRTVSRLAQDELGDLGHLGRVGGEEFALLASDVEPSLVLYRLEKFRARIALTPTIAGKGVGVHITISAGAAARTADGSFDQLYADADRALYAAKTSGRNRIRCSEVFSAACKSAPLEAEAPPHIAAGDETSLAG